MRALIQRVARAAVRVDGETVGAIERGLLVYVGVGTEDGPADAEGLAHKIRYIRIFPDEAGKMNRDVVEAGGRVLLVSSFTLQADAKQGRRPAFTRAADPARAAPLMDDLCQKLKRAGVVVETGRFGAEMAVESVNDGPINILIDTR